MNALPLTCPRCASRFTCGAATGEAGWCMALTLTQEARQALAARHAGCLCPPCLEALAAGPSADEEKAGPE